MNAKLSTAVCTAVLLVPWPADAETKAVSAAAAPAPTGPSSQAVMAGEYLFVAAQEPRDVRGHVPASVDGQAAQCLDNLRAVVESAGLTMEHVVYTHVYLDGMANLGAVDSAYAERFARNPPARAVFGMAGGPSGAKVMINAIAYRDREKIRSVTVPGADWPAHVSHGMLTGDLFFVSAMPGRGLDTGTVPETVEAQTKLALDNMGRVLDAAGLGHEHTVFMNPYLLSDVPYGEMNKVYATYFEFGDTPARATIFVSSLSSGSSVEFTGVAVRDLSQRQAVRPKNMAPSPTASPCVFGGSLYFCSAKSGFIPGVQGGIWFSSVENQFRQTMRNLLDGLEEAGLDFSHVVAANLYLDDMRDRENVDGIYELYFPGMLPARTVLQQLPPADRKPLPNGRWPGLEQMSLIAYRE